jgi:Holliday junction resolvase RusA-like endonuclease
MKQIIHGNVPAKSNCYRIAGNQMYKTAKMMNYEKDFYIQCGLRDKMIDGHFEIEIDVYFPTQKSDLDNSLKAVLDILQHKVKAIRNDNQCTKITARKFHDKVNPRIEFELKIV